GLADDLDALRAGQLSSIRLAQLEVAEDGRRVDRHSRSDLRQLTLGLRVQDILPRHRPAELLDVLGILTSKPFLSLKSWRTQRRTTDHARAADATIGHARAG